MDVAHMSTCSFRHKTQERDVFRRPVHLVLSQVSRVI